MLAAATTSLPETPHGERNWDYRYSWIRDSTFMLWGLYTLGFDWEANDFFYFVADAVADGSRRHPDHVRDRRREAAARGGARPPARATRARGRCGSATARGTSASTTCGARCSTRSTCTRSRATCCPSGSGRCSERLVERGDRQLAAARPRHLGGARRPQALHVVEAHVLGGRSTAARGSRGCATTTSTPSAGRRSPTRSTRTSARTASTTAACSPSTTTRPRSTRRSC